jgi:hypothetical protein
MDALGEQIYSHGYGLGAHLCKHLIGGQIPPLSSAEVSVRQEWSWAQCHGL